MPPLPPALPARLSRDRQFLLRASILTALASIAVAFLVSLVSPTGRDAETEKDALRRIVTGDRPEAVAESFEEWVYFLRTGYPVRDPDPLRDCRQIDSPPENDAREPIEPEEIADPTAELLHFLDLGLRLGDPDAAVAGLLATPADESYRNEFLGDIEFVRRNYEEASSFYLAAASQAGNTRDYNRRSAVIATWRSGDRPALRELLADPALRDGFEPTEQLNLFTDARDFQGLALAVVRYEISALTRPALIPAFFTGAVWFLILMPFWQVTAQRIGLSLLAVAAGVVSAGLTIFVYLLQERMQGFVHNPNDPSLTQVIYFVAGVALREETLKLLCFLPFAIVAARRGRYLDGLMFAAFVGLGFAFRENILYLEGGLASFTAWIRFLTANVLHFSLTGIAGYYLVRMIHNKFHGLEHFLFAFVAVVVAHGLYNSVLSIPALLSYSPLSTILVAAMAYRFFDPLRSGMETVGLARRVSPLGVFVLGSTLLTCGLMVASAWSMPFRFSLGVFASSVAGMIPLAFAYISRFRDL